MISWKRTNLFSLPSNRWVRYEIWSNERILGYVEIRDNKEGFICSGVWMKEHFCVLSPITFKGGSERTFNRYLKAMMLTMSIAVCK